MILGERISQLLLSNKESLSLFTYSCKTATEDTLRRRLYKRAEHPTFPLPAIRTWNVVITMVSSFRTIDWHWCNCPSGLLICWLILPETESPDLYAFPGRCVWPHRKVLEACVGREACTISPGLITDEGVRFIRVNVFGIVPPACILFRNNSWGDEKGKCRSITMLPVTMLMLSAAHRGRQLISKVSQALKSRSKRLQRTFMYTQYG